MLNKQILLIVIFMKLIFFSMVASAFFLSIMKIIMIVKKVLTFPGLSPL